MRTVFAALDVQPKMPKIHNLKQYRFFEYFSTKYFLTKYTQTVRDFYGLTTGNMDQIGPGSDNYVFSLSDSEALFLNNFMMSEKFCAQSV